MRTLLRGARVLREGRVQAADVLVQDGLVAAVGDVVPSGGEARALDLAGLTLVPGWIDVHVHGGGGFDLAAGDAGQIASYARWVARCGVTSFLATICERNVDAALPVLSAAAQAVGPMTGGATLLGINLEGPFFNPARGGALPRTWAARADVSTLDRLWDAAQGKVRLMTVAPELPGAEAVLREAADRGSVVALGHSDAGYAAARSAFESGAAHVTHAFNGMRPWHHRDPGIIGAALECEGVTVEVIADGLHLHPSTLRMLISAFGASRVALVTDAVALAGGSQGSARIAGQEARLSAGAVRLADGTLAGGAAGMDELVRNAVLLAGADLAAASAMASTVPARVIGLGQRKGRIEPGHDADLVALDAQLRVARVWVGGQEVDSRGISRVQDA